MVKSIHDVNLAFKFFLLAGSRFDDFGTKSRGSVELYTFFNDAKSASEVLIIKYKKRVIIMAINLSTSKVEK